MCFHKNLLRHLSFQNFSNLHFSLIMIIQFVFCQKELAEKEEQEFSDEQNSFIF